MDFFYGVTHLKAHAVTAYPSFLAHQLPLVLLFDRFWRSCLLTNLPLVALKDKCDTAVLLRFSEFFSEKNASPDGCPIRRRLTEPVAGWCFWYASRPNSVTNFLFRSVSEGCELLGQIFRLPSKLRITPGRIFRLPSKERAADHSRRFGLHHPASLACQRGGARLVPNTIWEVCHLPVRCRYRSRYLRCYSAAERQPTQASRLAPKTGPYLNPCHILQRPHLPNFCSLYSASALQETSGMLT